MALQHVKKMILVPSETVARLQEKPIIPTPSDKVRALDGEMDNALQEDGTVEERLRRYEQLLQRCMHFMTEQRKPFRLSIPETEDASKTKTEDSLEKSLEGGTPKSLRKYSTHLYNVLKSQPNVSWDQFGVVTIDGIPLPHSNIVDLIMDCVRKRKRANAQSWEPFVSALAKTNFPLGHINNDAYKQRIRELRGSGLTSKRKRLMPRVEANAPSLKRKRPFKGGGAQRKTKKKSRAACKANLKNGKAKLKWRLGGGCRTK